jgi:hypothetical protein
VNLSRTKVKGLNTKASASFVKKVKPVRRNKFLTDFVRPFYRKDFVLLFYPVRLSIKL